MHRAKVLNTTAFVATFDERFIPPDTTVPPFSFPGGTHGAKVQFWDAATRLVLQGSVYNFLNNTQSLGGTRWAVEMEHAHQGPVPPEGSLVTVFPRRRITFQAINSSRVTAEDVTIHAGGNMGFLEVDGGGAHTYRRVAIARKPGSAGLMALNADGFHSKSVGVGPTLEDSTISFTGDDFLNVHGTMLVVCKALPPTSPAAEMSGATSLAIIDVSSGSLEATRAGDTLSFYALEPGRQPAVNAKLGAGVVRALEKITDAATVKECHGASAAMQRPPLDAYLIVNTATQPVYRVDFEAALSAAVTASRYNLANVERFTGAGAVLRRNHFHDSCGSGGRILLKSRGATFSHNVARRFGGVLVTTEQMWLEGDLGMGGVRLENNTLLDARYAPPDPHVDVLAGLPNVTCADTSFMWNGSRTFRAAGC